MRQALWREVVLAEADRTLRVEGCDYFPPDSVRWEHLIDSESTSWCWWKGRARHLSIVVDDEVVADTAWYYARPWPLARRLRCHVAFGPAVLVTDTA